MRPRRARPFRSTQPRLRTLPLWLAALPMLLVLEARAFVEQDAAFDQIERIAALGGTTTQIGGGNPGGALFDSSDFVPPVDSQSGVSVTLPGYLFVDGVTSFDAGGASEPGNLPSLLIGPPTDLTFTTPGAGGPDGTSGDGSIILGAGGHVTFDFGATVAAQLGQLDDVVIFTNTASGGMATIELLDATLTVVLDTISTTVPGGAVGTGDGGLILDVADGTIFGGLRVTGTSGTLEIDAVALFYPPDVCGNGIVDAGEQCDDGATADGDCCSSTCQFEAADTVCRAASGACDAAELCNGAGSCPVDDLLPAGTTCRAAQGVCDLPEQCDGATAACPADVKSVAECRPSAGACDVAESCDGVSDGCPADGLVAAGIECRGSAGVCDSAELCSGASPSCPADAFASAGTVCRAAAGACDAPEVCDGASALCPANLLLGAGSTCRAAAGACDVEEQCDGVTAACPADAKSVAECRASAGACDLPEQCDGVSNDCPADVVVAGGIECRAAVGTCDVAESCDGASGVCPADALASAGVSCRAPVGSCDEEEFCDGASALCPSDEIAGAGTVCRASAGLCDAEEVCNGLDVACPVDEVAPDGSPCDMNVCTMDQCVGGVCEITPWPPGLPPPADFIFVIDATESMRSDFRRWLPQQLATFPGALDTAGIDWRVAIVRYGTSRRPDRRRDGPAEPDVLLPCTDDPALFEAALADLTGNLGGCAEDPMDPQHLNCIRRKTEAGTEAISYALAQDLGCRGGVARQNVILYTDEDDDSPVIDPVTMTLNTEKQEPPPMGLRCYGKPCEARWLPFQQRLDDTAASLVAQQAQLNVIENARNKPSTQQYGDPACTRLDGLSRLDPAATLECLLEPDRRGVSPEGICDTGAGSCTRGRVGQPCSSDADCNAFSLQAHLLASGVCGVGGICTGGAVGSACTSDVDCAILARAYQIPRNATEAETFFQDQLIPDKIGEQFCPAP